MPEDRSPRRRPERKQKENARHPRWAIWRLLLFALPIALVAFVPYAALRSPWLTVQSVSVAGAQTLDEKSLMELSGLQGKSMFRLPIGPARAHLLALPQLKSVSFVRKWPHGVTLSIEEREPYAFWTVGDRDYVVDVEGVVLAAGAPSGPAPHIYEPESSRVMGPGDRVHPDALALAERVYRELPRFLGQDVRELEYRAGIGVTAVFAKGMRVTFGDERAYDYKVAVLAKLLDQLAARNFTPRDIDLRFGERVTYD